MRNRLFNPFARHIPPSDPPVPSSDKCLCCGKKETEEEKLKRCTRCKMAMFCGRECQAMAWKGLGQGGELTEGEEHRVICTEIAKRNAPNMLPYQVRVVRHRGGAYIENGDDIPKARPITDEDNVDEAELEGLGACARDHYLTVVKNLTEEQKNRRYPLACFERWGGKAKSHAFNNSEYEEVKDIAQEGRPRDVPLRLLMDDRYGGMGMGVARPCGYCNDDGRQ